ncbi:hypothetical protein GCM10025868_45490 [Angustibacter aerolatus]|uniref:Shikimate kinase n=1 Tax=Angustibacter aerolatus TaxID=1162965 RepID=A0ABQ6JQ83_9ACTN|nr:hypothetical protein [Angustibacter aerolatus]GMA89299.1 hypothetical protein GCM10025868_45490 [Angustibacter aerolatus]
MWREDRVAALLDGAGAEPLLVSGAPSNLGVFLDRFQAVVLLSAPLDVLLARVTTRTTNDFGRSADDRSRIASDLVTVEPLLRRVATHELDTTRPLADVVDDLQSIVRALPA